METFIFEMNLGPDADGNASKLVFHVVGLGGEEALAELKRVRAKGKMFDPDKIMKVQETRIVKVFRESSKYEPLLLFSEHNEPTDGVQEL